VNTSKTSGKRQYRQNKEKQLEWNYSETASLRQPLGIRGDA